MKTIIITGCSRGIGNAAARYFLDSNEYNVIGTSTSGSANIAHDNFKCYKLLLEDESSVNEFTSILQKENISINALINNAAILAGDRDDMVNHIKLEKLKQTLAINLFGTINLTEKLAPLYTKNAHIINISSNWGSFSDPYFDSYNGEYKISKAALNMYTKLLASRMHEHEIKVSSFDPGWVKTDMGGDAAPKTAKQVAAELYNLLQSGAPSGNFWQGKSVREW